MGNIILEGLDFTGKTNTAKQISKVLGLKYINKQLILQIFGEDFYNIKDWEYTFKMLNNEDKASFDRHFMSLLVYWKMHKNNLYKRIVDENKAISDFLQNNPNSVLAFRTISYKSLLYKLNNRPRKGKEITEHDEKLSNGDYFNHYNALYYGILGKLIKQNEVQQKIIILKQKMDKFYFSVAKKQIIKKFTSLN